MKQRWYHGLRLAIAWSVGAARLGACLLAVAHCGWADDALWKVYQTSAQQAEIDGNLILTERAWRSAVDELGSVADTDPRKFVSLCHWALAQAQSGRPGVDETLARANTAASSIESDPTQSSIPSIQIAEGLRLWANALKARHVRYSLDRARLYEESLSKVLTRRIPSRQLAQLAWESSHAQRDVGHLAQALRHIDQALIAFHTAKISGHQLANAHSLKAIIHVELGSSTDANNSLLEWQRIDEKLKASEAEDRPREADFHWVQVRRAISIRDWPLALTELSYFDREEARSLLSQTSTEDQYPLATRHHVLHARVEVALVQGDTAQAVSLIEMMKQQAAAGSVECGESLVLDALLLFSQGQLSASLNRLQEARTILETSLGNAHIELIPVIAQQATIQCETGQFTEAMSLAREALTILRGGNSGVRPLPAGHPIEVDVMTVLARIEMRRHHAAEARTIATQAWEMTATTWPEGGAPTALPLATLAEAEAQAKHSSAAEHLASLLEIDLSSLSPGTRGLVQLHTARTAHLLNQPGQARTLYHAAMMSWDSCHPAEGTHPLAAHAALGLAILEESGQEANGEQTRVALIALHSLLGLDREVARELSSQGNAFYEVDQFREAAWLYQLAIQQYYVSEGADSASAALVLESLRMAQSKLKNAKSNQSVQVP